MAKKGFLDGYQTYDTSTGFGNSKKWQQYFKARMSKEDAVKILSDVKNSPHAILEVPLDATPDMIKKAFRKKIMECHEDRNQHRLNEAKEDSLKIIAAYTILNSKPSNGGAAG
ncbi:MULTISPECIES: J domain-containing protein [Sphingobacterium]|uniref:J domain-containing protein n=1 Tax=Sphingobacterium TaxID=28453 RepID=UPI0028B046CA|nr:J domain-containing protein [Sphingobacterium multivorum]